MIDRTIDKRLKVSDILKCGRRRDAILFFELSICFRVKSTVGRLAFQFVGCATETQRLAESPRYYRRLCGCSRLVIHVRVRCGSPVTSRETLRHAQTAASSTSHARISHTFMSVVDIFAISVQTKKKSKIDLYTTNHLNTPRLI